MESHSKQTTQQAVAADRLQRGRSGLARWASGSVADEVVRRGHGPVLLVRQSEEDDDTLYRGKVIPGDWHWLQTGALRQFFNRGTLAPQPVRIG